MGETVLVHTLNKLRWRIPWKGRHWEKTVARAKSPGRNSIENLWNYEKAVVWRNSQNWLTTLLPVWKHVVICVQVRGDHILYIKFTSLNFFLMVFSDFTLSYMTIFIVSCHSCISCSDLNFSFVFVSWCYVSFHKIHKIIVHSF